MLKARLRHSGGLMADKQRQSEKMQSDRASDTSSIGHGMSSNLPLPPEIQGEIGKKLRQVYGQLLAEPLPGKFQNLLEQLRKSDPKR